MFVEFFHRLRKGRIPVTIREYLVLLEAMEKGVCRGSVDEFYYLARTTLVKDEKNFDRFDVVFAEFFQGLVKDHGALFAAGIPDAWLKALSRHVLSEDEIAKLEKMDFDELLEELRKRLEEQDKEHSGGSKWIGTGGTSPYGHSGSNPVGIRIGGEGGGGSATKVWKKREYRALAGDVDIGIRNIKIALRRLRKFIREGAEDEFDLDATIHSTARNAGLLDIHMRAERRNRVKVLLFVDVGGSMDHHVKVCEELFSAARTEFKQLEHFYFHNFLYERVWRANRRGHNEWTPTWEVLNKYGPDYKVIFIGDATMSPYEVSEVGGAIEHWNDEPGALWMSRMTEHFPNLVWINPESPQRWPQTMSTQLIHRLLGGRMYPMTLNGLDQAMDTLRRRVSSAPPPRLH